MAGHVKVVYADEADFLAARDADEQAYEVRRLYVDRKATELRGVVELLPTVFMLEVAYKDHEITFHPPLEDFPALLVAEMEAVMGRLGMLRHLQVVTRPPLDSL
eukprot:1189520-Prorocentrum_minimum.AAC.1